MCLTRFLILRFLRIVIRPGQYHSHIHVLDHLPQHIEFLTFELYWCREGSLVPSVLKLDGDYVQGHTLSRSNMKIRFMPARQGAEFTPAIEAFLQDLMPRLHSTGRLSILRYRQTLDGEGIMYV